MFPAASNAVAGKATSSVERWAPCWLGANALKTALSGELVEHKMCSMTLIWEHISDGSIPPSRIPLLAAVGGSMVTRSASRRAFSKLGRSEFFP